MANPKAPQKPRIHIPEIRMPEPPSAPRTPRLSSILEDLDLKMRDLDGQMEAVEEGAESQKGCCVSINGLRISSPTLDIKAIRGFRVFFSNGFIFDSKKHTTQDLPQDSDIKLEGKFNHKMGRSVIVKGGKRIDTVTSVDNEAEDEKDEAEKTTIEARQHAVVRWYRAAVKALGF